MAVTYTIQFDVAASQIDRFHTLLGGVLDAMKSEPNFHEARLHADPENPLRWMLYETWEDPQDVLDVQIHRPYRDAWHAALDEVLTSPRVIGVWTPVRYDSGQLQTSKTR